MNREIEKQVRGILESDPHGVFATEDLCQRVYGGADEKHRASMRRVMRRIEETDPRYPLAQSHAKGVEMMLYNCQSARSVALMGYKKRLWLRWLLDPAHDAKAAKYIDERYEEFESGQEVDEDLIWIHWHARSKWLQRNRAPAAAMAAADARKECCQRAMVGDPFSSGVLHWAKLAKSDKGL